MAKCPTNMRFLWSRHGNTKPLVRMVGQPEVSHRQQRHHHVPALGLPRIGPKRLTFSTPANMVLRQGLGLFCFWVGTNLESIYLSMPYKDPERKRQLEHRHRQERSHRRKAQRAKISPTISPKVVAPAGHNPKQENHSCWGVFLLFAGIAVGLPILLAGFGSGQPEESGRVNQLRIHRPVVYGFCTSRTGMRVFLPLPTGGTPLPPPPVLFTSQAAMLRITAFT